MGEQERGRNHDPYIFMCSRFKVKDATSFERVAQAVSLISWIAIGVVAFVGTGVVWDTKCRLNRPYFYLFSMFLFTWKHYQKLWLYRDFIRACRSSKPIP